jgi:hypothetical protein
MPTNPIRVVLGEVVSDCRHGSPMVEQDRVTAVVGYIKRLDKQCIEIQSKCRIGGTQSDDPREELFEANLEILEQFWSEPKHTRLIDAKMVRYCVAFATSEALEENMQLSRVVALLGTYLAAWFKLGKDAFLGALHSMHLESMESSSIQPMIDFQASMEKMGTDREFVLFLAKQIPCSCLDEDKKKAKQTPKTGWCSYCNSEVLKLELKMCGQCKSTKYCSKECQVADWRGSHKRECKGYKHLLEQNNAFKARRVDDYERHKKQRNYLD